MMGNEIEKERRSKKQRFVGAGLWVSCVAYAVESIAKYGPSSLGIGAALLAMAILMLSQEIHALVIIFGHRKGEGNGK